MKNIQKLLVLSALFIGTSVSAQSVNVYSTTQNYDPYYSGSTQSAPAQKYPQYCNALIGIEPFGYGESGEHIKRLQVVLGQEGISYVGATGYFGPVTRSAVKVFQARNGISQTGAVGPITLARMKLLWCGGNTTTVPPTNTGYIPNGIVEVSIAPISSSNAGVMIGWNSKNATSCTLNNQTVAPNGQQNFYITSETNYTISCNGVSKTIVVRPNQDVNNLPNVNVYINPTSALVNTYATIYWTSSNVSYCTLNGQSIQTSGSQQIFVSGVSTSYTIKCMNQSGQSVSTTVYSNVGGTPGTNTSNGISLTLTSDKTNINSTNDPITFIATVRNNSNTSVRMRNNFGICSSDSQDVTMTINGTPFDTFFNVSTASCFAYPTPTYINLAPGQSYTRTFLGGFNFNTNNVSNGNHVAVATLKLANENGVFGTVTSNSLNFTINGTGGTGSQSFTANPANPYSGQAVTLSWSAPNSSYCNITGGSTVLSNQSALGSTVVYPTTNTSYHISCYNAYNQSSYSAYAYVTVSGTGGGTGSTFTLNPTSVNITGGQSTYITVTGTNITSCVVNGGTLSNYSLPLTLAQSYPVQAYGTISVNPTQTTSYNFTCYGSNGVSTTQTSTVIVTGSTSGNLNVTIFANPTNAVSGQAVNLTWSSTNASYCTLSANGNTILSNQPGNGSYYVYPAISTNYQVNCYNSGGQSAANYAYVTVGNSSGNSSVSISPTSNLVIGSQSSVTWNYSNIGTAAQGVLISLYDSNNVYVGHLTRNTSNPTNGTFAWTIPTVIYGYGGDVMSCITVNGQQYCGIDPKQIQSGTYKLRATYFTPSNACFGFCQNVPGQQTLGSVDSSTFTITSGSSGNVTATVSPTTSTISSGQSTVLTFAIANANYCTLNGGVYNNTYYSGNSLNGPITVNPTATTTYVATCYNPYGVNVTATAIVNVGNAVGSNTITLTSRQNGYVVVSVLNYCNVTGYLDWGDGSTKVNLFAGVCGSGGNYAHQYTASTGQSFLVRVTDQYNNTISSLSVVPFP